MNYREMLPPDLRALVESLHFYKELPKDAQDVLWQLCFACYTRGGALNAAMTARRMFG